MILNKKKGRPQLSKVYPGAAQQADILCGPDTACYLLHLHYIKLRVCHSMPSFQIQLLLSCEVCELVATNTLVRQLSAPMAMR